MRFLFLSITAIFSFLICIIFRDNNDDAYHSIFLLPLTFLIITIILYFPLFKRKTVHLTLIIFILISWLRFVLTPFIGTIGGYYTELDVLGTTDSVRFGIYLMVYEYIFLNFILVLLTNMKWFKKKPVASQFKERPRLYGNSKVYIIFVVFALIVYIFFGKQLDTLSFLVIDVDTLARIGDATSTFEIGVRQIITSGILFLYLTFVYFLYRKYILTSKNMYFYLIMIISLLSLSIIVGERRSIQLYLAFATSFILIYMLPEKKKTILFTIVTSSTAIILLMTVYKSLNAFMFGSYSAAITNTSITLTEIAHNLDLYFYGIKVISSNLILTDAVNIQNNNIIIDFFSSIFGLHFFVPENYLTTSQLYNSYIYNGSQLSGHLFSSLAYGYIFLPWLLSPIITAFNIIGSLVAEKLMYISKYIEFKFIFAYIFIRFSFGMFSIPTSLLNMATQYAILNGIIILIAGLFIYRKKRKVSCYERKSYI